MTTTRGTLGLERFSDRCAAGYADVQHPDLCGCAGAALKAQGIARADAAADPDVRAMVDEEIRRAAASGQVFTANDVRPFLPDDVGPLMGARFAAAAKAGLITHCGYEPSTKASTHAHPISKWTGAAA